MKRSFSKFVLRIGEIGLRKEIEARSLAHRISLKDLYGGPRTASVCAARRSVYLWLKSQGKSNNEIARLFDKSPSSVVGMTKEAEHCERIAAAKKEPF